MVKKSKIKVLAGLVPTTGSEGEPAPGLSVSTSTSGGKGSIPRHGTKILHAML